MSVKMGLWSTYVIVGDSDPDHWLQMRMNPGELPGIPEGYHLERWTYDRTGTGDRGPVKRERIALFPKFIIVKTVDPDAPHIMRDFPHEIKDVGEDERLEKWWYAHAFTGDPGKRKPIIREPLCPCCFYYGKRGYIWNAGHWMHCPACSRVNVIRGEYNRRRDG